MSSCMGIVSVGHDLFPEIDKQMTKYLTPHILSAEQSEMAQCLYFVDFSSLEVADEFVENLYDAKQILLKSMIAEVGEENIQEVWKITDIRPQNSKYSHFVVVVDSISYLCSCMSNISRGIICRHYFRVMMYSKIAGFHIQMIPSRWYTDAQKDNNIVTEACCFINKESAKNYSNELLTPNPSTIPKSVTHVLRRAAQRKLKYGEVWGLARHTAQLAVEYNNYSEMVTWLKEFIGRHKEIVAGSVQESIQYREIVAGSVQNRDFQEFTEIQNDANKENELALIKNPLVSRRKGRPETKRYKSATEKKGKSRAYACGTCNQPGHNSATCQNH
ncbi:hypothetical protein Glove_35g32 [Diversispora epigaea]|uniref:SWIM-type domain-containing protein n=1 Tax=Diversispora epigaea TaxID=1348612 RepID=A0A397JJG3_9GLOM|nr:hypothetical protein Glove_35g32 [Diversispora epigaea]